MELSETMKLAKSLFPQEYSSENRLILRHSDSFSGVQRQNIQSLLVCCDYSGEIPELSMFPMIKQFHCTKRVSPEWIARQDFSGISDLCLCVMCVPGTIQLHAPVLEKIHLCITDNEKRPFLNSGNKAIDLSGMPLLHELKLSHCSDYSFASSIVLPNVKKMIIEDCCGCDFSFFENLISVTDLSVWRSEYTDVSFIPTEWPLKRLDLSHGSINNCSGLEHFHGLEYLNLYRNPLSDDEEVRNLGIKTVVITEREHVADRFEHELRMILFLAQTHVENARKPDPQRTDFIQKAFDRQTDEELFERLLKELIEQSVKNYRTGKAHRRLPPTAADDFIEYVSERLPFIFNNTN